MQFIFFHVSMRAKSARDDGSNLAHLASGFGLGDLIFFALLCGLEGWVCGLGWRGQFVDRCMDGQSGRRLGWISG